MASPTWRRLFTVLAPITVPLAILFMAGANLLGGAFYIVIENTVAPLLRRPIALTRKQMIILAIPVLVAAPLAMLIHLVLWLLKQLGVLLCWLGHWQTTTTSRPWSFMAGLIWSLAAVWTVLTCLNAATGLSLIGRPIEGRDTFVEFYTRSRTLGDLPAEAQSRRETLKANLQTDQENIHPQWQDLLTALSDDQAPFGMFPTSVMRRLTAMPWFFVPGELSPDGVDHSVMLFGPLLFVIMVLVCWPGMNHFLRFGWLRYILFLIRAVATTYAIFYLVTWVPRTAYLQFPFLADTPPLRFRIFSPAYWLGFDYQIWIRPEWYLFNAGLWLAFIGLVIFIWYLAWRIGPFLGWPRYYIAFLSTRLLQRKRIAFFSVGAVTLCVAMMIIVISVMGGFVDSIRNRAHGLLGDLVMDGGQAGFPYYQEFIDEISLLQDPQTGEKLVMQATPLINSYGILQFPNTKRTKPVRIWGVRLEEYVRVNEFGKDLYYRNRYGGKSLSLKGAKQPFFGYENGTATLPDEMDVFYRDTYLPSLSSPKREEEKKKYRRDAGMLGFPGPGVFDFTPNADQKPAYAGKDLPGIIVGRDILFRRLASGEYQRNPDYPCGEPCFLTMLPLTRSGDVSPEPPPKPSFRYVDDSRTGIYEIDSMNVYVDFDNLQKLLSMNTQERAEGNELHLLDLPASVQSDFDAGRLPENLAQSLGNLGFPIAAEAKILTKEPGKKWRIKNENRDLVVVKREGGLLEVLSTFTSPRCSQIQIKLRSELARDRAALEEQKRVILDTWQSFRQRVPADSIEGNLLRMVDVQTWEEMQKDYIAAIEKEKFLVVIMFGVISTVAVFLILCIFYMIVQEKIRDIGIIKSVGGSAEGVTAVFLAYGAAIGLVGCLLGSLLGITFVEHINDVQEFLARINPAWRVWSPETYSFDKIPDVWKWSEVIGIGILAILASVVGAAFPALRAGRTWPVETLRYE